MDHRLIPGSDIKVSPVCLGCWQINGGNADPLKTWAGQSEEVSRNIIDKAIECGINFFDTAEGYVNSEAVMGRLLEGRRRNVVIASKFGFRRVGDNPPLCVYTPEDVECSIRQSLQSLQTDYIDIYQVHFPSLIKDSMSSVVAELKRQQAKGSIRYYSLCNYGPIGIQEMLDAGGKPLTNQLPYNLLYRGIEYEVIPKCLENNISILPYSALQQGLLTGKFKTPEDVPEGRRRTRLFSKNSTSMSRHGGEGAEKEMFQTIDRIREICKDAGIEKMSVLALSWLLQQPGVSSVIAGASCPEQVAMNSEIVTLSQEVLQKLGDCTEVLKALMGKEIDMWSATSRAF